MFERANRHKGAMLVHFAAICVLGLMMSALTIDLGYYFAAQNQLQTGADSAALAAADTFYKSNYTTISSKQTEAIEAAQDFAEENLDGKTVEDNDVDFGFINPTTKKYDPTTFESPSTDPSYALTGGYNAVRVAVRRQEESENGALPTIMAQSLGIKSMDSGAYSVAFMDTTVGSMVNGGLRPFYVCEGALNQAVSDGNISNNNIQIYGDTFKVDGTNVTSNCPQPGSGNWGFSDLRDCAAGAAGMSTFADWVRDGYPGSVSVGECYSSEPGNAIGSRETESALNQLISDRTVIPLPVYSSWSGGGSNTSVTVTSFVGFVVTGYKSTGSANSRYIQGYFVRAACRQSCSSTSNASGVGGASMVKIRLAYQ